MRCACGQIEWWDMLLAYCDGAVSHTRARCEWLYPTPPLIVRGSPPVIEWGCDGSGP